MLCLASLKQPQKASNRLRFNLTFYCPYLCTLYISVGITLYTFLSSFVIVALIIVPGYNIVCGVSYSGHQRVAGFDLCHGVRPFLYCHWFDVGVMLRCLAFVCFAAVALVGTCSPSVCASTPLRRSHGSSVAGESGVAFNNFHHGSCFCGGM